MKIAILGFGTIGRGVFELLSGRSDITVKRILDLRKWNDLMTTDFSEIADDPEIELVVETMGGVEPARKYVLECHNKGKHVVTANKLLVSSCASELNQTSRANHKAFLFSAACGGGIPYLTNLQQTQFIDRVTELGGILNGTTNYILDQLQTNDISFEEALKKAQSMGYAEKDPTSDIDGFDTARKLILSCAVAYGLIISEERIICSGISNINEADIQYAKEKGKVIRLTAYACPHDNNELEARVLPGMFGTSAPEASICSNVNYAWYKAEKSGLVGFNGQGAGSLPTAANIIKDIISILGGRMCMFPDTLTDGKVINGAKNSYYVRLPMDCDIAGLSVRNTIDAGEYKQIETLPMRLDDIPLEYIKQNKGFIMVL